MTLAGIWRDVTGNTLLIDGRDPSYTFREHNAFGMVTCQGIIRQQASEYQVTGNGVSGPISLRMWLGGPDVLHAQGNFQIDNGGMIDQLVRGLVSQMPAMAPVVTFTRQREQIQLQPPIIGDSDQRQSRRISQQEAPRPRKREEEKPKPQEAERRRRDAEAESKRGSNDDPMAEVQQLIGMASVKEQLEQLDAWAWRRQELKQHGLEAEAPSMHMCFSGGPGTGKTTIARIIGRLLKKYELLEHGRVAEVGRADLVGEFIGQTSPKAEKLIEDSIGGVLFIDEAYALSEPGAGGGARDYGSEALAVLIAGMENHRDKLCVIVAGYPAEMERFIDANAGLASRISRHIKFPDFTEQELQAVFEAMTKSRKLTFDPDILPLLRSYVRRAKAGARPRQWGNARSVRNILERGIENQSVRLRKAGGRPTRGQLLRLEIADFSFLTAPDVTVT